ncbi:MAG TPA: hypothetical protein DD979_14685, partial [Gammaproteobacteria bacterium]|nr:hypothetical protein [Gammaproteobacteria bacterium]
MKLTRLFVLVLSNALLVPTATAQLLIDPSTQASQGATRYGVYLGTGTTDYDIEESGLTGDISRDVLSGFAAYGLVSTIDVYAAAAYGFDTDGGDGTEIAIGLNGGLPWRPIKDVDLSWYSQVSIFDETLEDSNDGIKTENVLSEWLVGVVAAKDLNPDLRVYGGIEAVAYSLGETVLKVEELDDTESDFERSDRLGIRAGVDYKGVQMHVGLGHESSVLLGLRLPFTGFASQRAPEPMPEP